MRMTASNVTSNRSLTRRTLRREMGVRSCLLTSPGKRQDLTPVFCEATNAVRIQNLRPGDNVLLVPKPKSSQIVAGSVAGVDAGSAEAGNEGNSSWSMFGVMAQVGTFLLDMIVPGGISDVGAGSDIVPLSINSTGNDYDLFENY